MLRRVVLFTLFGLLTPGITALAEEVRGVIQKVDPEKQEIVVQLRGKAARGQTLNIAIDKETQIKIGGHPGTLAEVKAGDRTRVYYENRDGHRVALGLAVHGAVLKDLASKESEPPPPVGDANTLTGVLVRVAQTDREIVVVGPGSKGERELETTVAVPEKASITRDDKSVKFEDLKEGERVTVRVARHNGKAEAQSIQVGKGSPPKGPDKTDKIAKLRMALKIADFLLQQMADAPKP